jgi:purine-nucleoside phosphorylase
VHELVDTYRAKTLIRVGTCGGLADWLPVRGLVISQAAGNDSSLGRQFFGPFEYAPAADFGLLRLAAERATALRLTHAIGRTASSDFFYHPQGRDRFEPLRQSGVIAVDMETSALYTMAARFGVRALSICMVVDNMITGAEIDHAERQAVFRPMIELALDLVATEAGAKA